MMIVQYMPQAEEVLYEIANWVESKNTPGSGFRFVEAFMDQIAALALPNVKYADCKHEIFAREGLQCVPVQDWIVVFRIEKNKFTVHFIVHGSLLK
jgi:plasmid stabilization system protein ParE